MIHHEDFFRVDITFFQLLKSMDPPPHLKYFKKKNSFLSDSSKRGRVPNSCRTVAVRKFFLLTSEKKYFRRATVPQLASVNKKNSGELQFCI